MKFLLSMAGVFLLLVAGYLFIYSRTRSVPIIEAEISDIKSILTFIAAIVSMTSASALGKMDFQLNAINSIKAESLPAETPDAERPTA